MQRRTLSPHREAFKKDAGAQNKHAVWTQTVTAVLTSFSTLNSWKTLREKTTGAVFSYALSSSGTIEKTRWRSEINVIWTAARLTDRIFSESETCTADDYHTEPGEVMYCWRSNCNTEV